MPSIFARLNIDMYIILLVSMVVLASFFPARGAWADILGICADAGIVILFFMHGARLSRKAVIDGVRHWRLHTAVGAVTYGVFPILGLAISSLPFIDRTLATGILFLTLLPSTVQSSIAFTAMAKGNVAGAVCSASFSNLAGIFLTPALVALLITGGHGGVTFGMVLTIVFQLLVPFLGGHFLRPQIGSWIDRQKKLLMIVDRGSILLIVFTAFSAAVVDGLWTQVSAADLAAIALASLSLLAFVLVLTAVMARWLGFPREDAIVLQFCGSKKSLASGVPMAGVLFPAAQVGAIVLPLMFFHQIQLMICAVLARRYSMALDEGGAKQVHMGET